MTITGTGFPAGATVSLGRDGSDEGECRGRHIDHSNDAGARVGSSERRRDQHRCAEFGTLNNGYTYTGAIRRRPSASITPNTGSAAGGTSVTITGTGFLAGATVSLGRDGGDQRECRERHVDHGNHAGACIRSSERRRDQHRCAERHVEQRLYLLAGQSGADGGFDYAEHRTAAGGTSVTITGTGFLAGATVTLGGTAATNVNVASSTSITATTPAHAAGAVSVVVTNSDAQSGSLNNGYTYRNPAPTVTSITPTTGTAAGGTSVTITGTGFLAGATVSLGGTAATGVNVVGSTSITATTPAHAAGAVNVVVTNTDAQSGTLTNGYTYTTSTGGAPITFVQVKSATPQTASASVAVTYTIGADAGNLNVVVVGWNDTTSTVTCGNGQPGQQLCPGDRTDEREQACGSRSTTPRTSRRAAIR